MRQFITNVMLGMLATTTALTLPRDSADGKYHGISLMFVTSAPGEPRAASPSPIEIDVLTNCHNFPAYSIEFQDIYFNVDIDKVECRAYKDESGQVPGSAVFTHNKPAQLSTNPVTVGSILCYIVEDSETE